MSWNPVRVHTMRVAQMPAGIPCCGHVVGFNFKCGLNVVSCFARHRCVHSACEVWWDSRRRISSGIGVHRLGPWGKSGLKRMVLYPFLGYLRGHGQYHGLNTYKSLFETRKTHCFGGFGGPYPVHIGRVTGVPGVPPRCSFGRPRLPLFRLHPIRAKAQRQRSLHFC